MKNEKKEPEFQSVALVTAVIKRGRKDEVHRLLIPIPRYVAVSGKSIDHILAYSVFNKYNLTVKKILFIDTISSAAILVL